ncbi:hypothetical protein QBC34DRAFT_419998 [Podospora aff. communis PSN243]|uniref:DRBM domain-containing protein n=1 Tax=Podospora aff. communis PSN243 TaxID=3040156 RepID=A0AAV9H733_9PEZI|nr:hypothetical protein QBC34DRAFT_419998 [Podospora aff. communis PSN243]
MAPADEPIDLSDIKEWISAYEANPQPASLTPAQRKAILDFKAATAKEVAAPEIGEEDWISALQLYRDTDASKRRGVEFTYEDVGANGQFKCFCNFKGPHAPERMTFPRGDCGFVAVDTKGTLDAPSFSKKKDARRYAAKQTVIWLRRQGQEVPFPKVGNKTKDRVVVVDRVILAPATVPKSEGTRMEGVAGPANSSASTLDPVKPSNTNGDIGDAAEVPATVRVIELCNALSFQAPAYRLSPADNGQNDFYNGYADFGTDSLTFPKTLGCVSNCCTKSGTKEQIAAMVLEHLLAYQARRNIQLANVEGKFGDASGGAALT